MRWTLIARVFILLFAAAHACAAQRTVPQSGWQTVLLGPALAQYRFALHSNHDLRGDLSHITSVISIQHGLSRDGDAYYATAAKVMAQLGGDEATSLLIVPQFFAANDASVIDLGGIPFWTRGGWLNGDNAIGGSLNVSSLQVYDDLLGWLSNRSRFPALRRIVLAGHSAGGQLVQRYAALSQADEALRGTSISVHYVVANPSSYLYFTGERPTATGFAPIDASACPTYNDFKYGFSKMIPYGTGIDPRTAFERYAARDVVYLLGDRDNDPRHPSMDKRCGAQTQGASRLERGHAYLRYERHLAQGRVKLAHRAYEVAGIGHDEQGMFSSTCAARVIFGSDSAPPGAATCKELHVGVKTLRPAAAGK